MESADAHPKPCQRPRLPILLGGRAGPRALALAARWADEYNTFSASVDELRERRDAFAEGWKRAGGERDAFRFSAMGSIVVGADEGEVRARVARLAEWQGREPDSVL